MEDLELVKILYAQNPWWNGKAVEVPPKARSDFHALKKALADTQITALLGSRRVGKSVLMLQLVNSLLAEKVDPKRILFVQLDDLLLEPLGPKLVQSVLETYFKLVLQKEFADLDERTYVFMDEVSHAEKWSETLKSYYDRRKPLKFVVSGSSSAGITRGSSESLAGRISLNYVMTLKYSDFLKFSGFDEDFEKQCLDLRTKLEDALRDGNAARFWQHLERFAVFLVPFDARLDATLMGYLVKGGYIELVGNKDYPYCAKYLHDLVQLVIYRDIVKVFDIRTPKNMEDLLLYLARHSSDKISENSLGKISSELNMEKNTVRQYLEYLELVFIVNSSAIFASNRAKQLRNPRKIYIRDVGIRNSFNGTFSPFPQLDPLDAGKMAETVAHDHALRLASSLDPANAKCDYWSNGGEIDNVVSFGKIALPIEVKYRNEIKAKDADEAIKFIADNKCPFGIMITKNKLARDEKNRLFYIPLKIFLLMC